MNELRFAFGQNWSDFVEKKLSDAVIGQSMDHMAGFLREPSLSGKSFLDIGCGSGIHSLAALRLGADTVVSFDYDENSVATAKRVRDWAGIPEERWKVFQGSVLDDSLMESLGRFDIVYSWGVLHHTGAMWEAVRRAMMPLKPGGEFYIALYSTEIYVDPPPEFWIRLKRAYNRANPLTRKLMELKYASLQFGAGSLEQVNSYGKRGMSFWTDVKDWLGGYPMEFASLHQTRAFCDSHGGLDLVNLKTGEGCTEYLFANLGASAKWRAIEEQRLRRPMRGPFRSREGYRFDFPAPDLSARADSDADPVRSRVMIFENDKPFGIAHSTHADIASRGAGRFSHWNGALLFSTSDNSDPNSNGRTYSYCEAY